MVPRAVTMSAEADVGGGVTIEVDIRMLMVEESIGENSSGGFVEVRVVLVEFGGDLSLEGVRIVLLYSFQYIVWNSFNGGHLIKKGESNFLWGRFGDVCRGHVFVALLSKIMCCFIHL